MLNFKPWSKEEDEQLRVLWGEGKTGGEIGAELGFSRAAVIGKARRLKLASRAGTHGRGRKRHQRKLRAVAEPQRANLVSLMDLETHHCRWPMDTDPVMFCGGPADLNASQPYCAFHHRLAYQNPTERREFVPMQGERGGVRV